MLWWVLDYVIDYILFLNSYFEHVYKLIKMKIRMKFKSSIISTFDFQMETSDLNYKILKKMFLWEFSLFIFKSNPK